MHDLIGSMSTIKNFMGNAGRNTCNDYLYRALEDALECMEYRVPEKTNLKIAEENIWVGKVVFHEGTVLQYCPHCGIVVTGSQNFCSRCGKALNHEGVSKL